MPTVIPLTQCVSVRPHGARKGPALSTQCPARMLDLKNNYAMKDSSASRLSAPGKGGSARGVLLGNACILVATLFFGINIPVVKLLIPKWMTAVDVTVWRIVGGALLMWLVSLFVKTERIEKGDWLKIILGGAVGLFSFLYLFNLSLRYANPIDVSIILTLPPMFVILIGVLFLHQRPSWVEYAGVAVSFAGAFLVIAAQGHGVKGSDQLLGTLLALASTLCYAFYLVIMQKPSHKYHSVSLLRWVFLFAAIPALCCIGQMPHAALFHTHEAEPWLLVAFVVVCPSFLSYFLLTPAIKLIGSELVSIYQYLVPVFATAASVWTGIATLHSDQIVAMVVIVAGMLLTNLGKRRRARKEALPTQQGQQG